VYLTTDQRRALLASIEDSALHDFVHALCLLPLRPGALAALTVGDFDAKAKAVHVRVDKAGAGRKVPLSASAAELFRRRCKSKLPAARIFTQANGRPWRKDVWRVPFREACASAGFEPNVTAYALRHATITDLVTNGFDVLSVAAIAGTSVDLIEKSYGHLRDDQARTALEGLAL
jgi:integrase